MKTKIKIILGFLESGKTNFINNELEEILNNNNFQREKIVIIQYEMGISEINTKFLNYPDFDIILLENEEDEIKEEYIKDILLKYKPSKLFIESNGMKNCKDLISIFNKKEIRKLCYINDIITLIDANTFSMYFKNMYELIYSQIYESETIILNNTDDLDESNLQEMLKQISKINETSKILKSVNYIENLDAEKSELAGYVAADKTITSESDLDSNIKSGLQNSYIELSNDFFSIRTFAYSLLFILAFIFIAVFSISDINLSTDYIEKFQKFYTIFISILIEGIPFILIGSFISSIIQIYLTENFLVKVLPKNIFLSCLFASVSGLLFPICDCGTIPVVKGFIKKGVPLCVCITFMLSAPIVNPISILATIYAFQDMKSVVIYRILSGIIISISVGLIMHYFTKDTTNILTNTDDKVSLCNCALCNNENLKNATKLEKIKNVFLHTSDEFFNIGKFMILGSFISSAFQCMTSVQSNIYKISDNRSSLILMIILAFLLSVCSTSDAFIGKSFLNMFPLNSIMGFLVVGPMLDLKNTLVLIGNFEKKFVFKLIFVIIFVSLLVLMTLRFPESYTIY